VVTFDSEATPFPGVDTNAIVFMIRAAEPLTRLHWCRCSQADSASLQIWVESNFVQCESGIEAVGRGLSEALLTGLSRRPVEQPHCGPTLRNFAKTMRGIATGANEFFHLTRKQAEERQIPSEFLIPAVGRTRDVTRGIFTPEDLDALDAEGKPTLLLYLDGRPLEQFPASVQTYIRHGESLGLPEKTLIATRKPWYKMERRIPPPFLFAYLGRRNARFIKNEAGVVPLTGFLCVYPVSLDISHSKLWRLLQHPNTIGNLHLVGKSYGGGAIKVEPRALERLPIPAEALTDADLMAAAPLQAEWSF
jgi:adenine-specific DNA-methyltransferase